MDNQTSEGQREIGEMPVTLHYAEWARLIALLDGHRSREAQALAAALRRQLVDQLLDKPLSEPVR